MSVLVVDYAVKCSGSQYQTHAVVAAILVAVAVLVPLCFLRAMMTAGAAAPEDEHSVSGDGARERERAVRRITEELGVREQDARNFVHDMTEQTDYSFLTAGFRPAFAWWENVDMLRKLSARRAPARIAVHKSPPVLSTPRPPPFLLPNLQTRTLDSVLARAGGVRGHRVRAGQYRAAGLHRQPAGLSCN